MTSTKTNVLSEISMLKNDMLTLMTLAQNITNRLQKLEESVEKSRKRPAGSDFDSDIFSEEELSAKTPKQWTPKQDSKTPKQWTSMNKNTDQVSTHSNSVYPSSSRLSQPTSSVSSPSPCSKTEPAFVIDADRTVCYTDGCCHNNGKPTAKGGIGVFWNDDSELNVSDPLPGKQTNNRAEMQAACRALRQAKEMGVTRLEIRTDSGYLKNGIEKWIKAWKNNGWKTAVSFLWFRFLYRPR